MIPILKEIPYLWFKMYFSTFFGENTTQFGPINNLAWPHFYSTVLDSQLVSLVKALFTRGSVLLEQWTFYLVAIFLT